MSQDRILQETIYSQLNPATGARVAFETKLVKQSEQYTEVVKSYLDVIPGKALGVTKEKLNHREIMDVQSTYQDDPEKMQAIIKEGKLCSPIEDRFSERDAQAVKELLTKLKKDGALYNALIRFANIESPHGKPSTEAEKKILVMMGLHNAGVLPVIQYVICDSLLTGGMGCAQSPNNDTLSHLARALSPLIAATGFKWSDFFMLASPAVVLHKSIYIMATELDQPDMLLAVLGKESADTFTAKDGELAYDGFTKQTLLDYVTMTDKMAIEKRMQQDIANEKMRPLLPTQRSSQTAQSNSPTNLSMTPTGRKISPRQPNPLNRFKASTPKSSASASAHPSIPLGNFNLHATKNTSFSNDCARFLVSAVAKIIYAAEKYQKIHPEPTGYIHRHSHQKEAKQLKKDGEAFFSEIVAASPKDYVKISIAFLSKFNDFITTLSSGELSHLITEPGITKALSMAVEEIKKLQPTSITTRRMLANIAALDKPLPHPAALRI
jgi:hypothetical protein